MLRLFTSSVFRTLALQGCLLFSASALAQFGISMVAVQRSVVFLYLRDSAGQLQGGGTGFLLAVKTKSDPAKAYILLVTARHIVDPSWAGCQPSSNHLVLTVNLKEGASPQNATRTKELPIEPAGFVFPDDNTVDIAVTALNPFQFQDSENFPISSSVISTPTELKQIGIGSQIISAGLLLGAQGVQRNYPLFKFGYVSSIPDEKIPTACCAGCVTRPETEWLIAAALVPGNSGSPIYYAPPSFGGVSFNAGRPVLLGVQSTSFTGSDVAGMAPVTYLPSAIRKLTLPDADFPGEIEPMVHGTPSMGVQRPPALAGPQLAPK